MGFSNYGYRSVSESRIDNEVPLYLSGQRKEAIARVAPGAADGGLDVYADELVQEHLGGKIARWGYKDAGGVTHWLMDVSKDGVRLTDVALSGQVSIYQRGPVYFDVEAYADDEDLNPDGTFKNNVDASYAVNAATAAIRVQQTQPGLAGTWASSRVLRFNSPVYTIEHTLDFTAIVACSIIVACPGACASLYSGDGWAGAPPGSAAALLGLPATMMPMVDCTAMAGTTVIGLTLCAQKLLVGNPAPAVRPAVGWLVGSTETWSGSGSVWGVNVGANSNNNTFWSCAAVGWTSSADWAFVNSVIHSLEACSGQSFANEAASMSFYAGRTVLDTSGEPNAAGTAFDSAFYPTTATPASGQQRLCRTEAGTGNIVITRSEFHDMSPNIYASASQSNKKRTMLFHKTIGIKLLDVPISGSGITQVEFSGGTRSTDFELVEPYNKGEPWGPTTRSSYFCYFKNTPTSDPTVALRIHQLQGSRAPQMAWFGGPSGGQPAWANLYVSENDLNPSVPFLSTLAGFGGTPTAVTLAYSELELNGAALALGGSLGETVTLINPGAVTFSGGGYDRSKKLRTDGGLGLYGAISTNQNMSGAGSQFNQYLAMVNGTVGAPAYTWNADPDSGLYRIGEDTYGFAAGAVLVAAITPAGLQLGTSPAALTGDAILGLPNNKFVYANSAGGSAIRAFGVDSADIVQFGNDSSASVCRFAAANQVQLRTGGVLRLLIDGAGLGFFGAGPVAQQTGGVATAGASYTATEQGMLQKAYAALRAYGLLT